MKARTGSVIAATSALFAVALLGSTARAQNVVPPPGPNQPAYPNYPSAPTYPTYPSSHYPMGEQRAETIRPNPLLLTTGGATLAAAYVPGFVVAASSDHDGDKWLYAPLIGPWIDLASRGCENVRTPSCGTSGFDRVALIGSGVLQALGAVQLIGAFTMPHKRLSTAQATGTAPTIQISPATFGTRAGLVAFGTF